MKHYFKPLVFLVLLLLAILPTLPACHKDKEQSHAPATIQASPTPSPKDMPLIRLKTPLISTPYFCPDCLEYGCIYEAIDSRTEGTPETAADYIKAINDECHARVITDQNTIELIKFNYNL